MANPLKTGDSGTASVPTARAAVFAGGQPASTTAADYGVATATAARPDVFNATYLGVTNPPSATADPAST